MTYFIETVTHGKPATPQDHVLRIYRAMRKPRPAPRMTARDALNNARATVAKVQTTGHTSRVPLYIAGGIWSDVGGDNGCASQVGSTRGRWVEEPRKIGLRLVGTPSDILTRSDVPRGYYLDSDCFESVKGVVFKLSSKRGTERYLAGYADPYNGDGEGDGPAWLSTEVFATASEAAREADHVAERYGDSAREYADAYLAGQNARGAAIASRAVAGEYADSVRTVRALFRGRNWGFAVSTPKGKIHWRGLVRAQVKQARKHCESLQTARKAFSDALDLAPSKCHDSALWGSWSEGYDSGANL